MGAVDTLRPWAFPVEHIPQGTTAEQSKESYNLSIDSDLYGFTPLNQPKESVVAD